MMHTRQRLDYASENGASGWVGGGSPRINNYASLRNLLRGLDGRLDGAHSWDVVWLGGAKIKEAVGTRRIDNPDIAAEHYKVDAHGQPKTRHGRIESAINAVLAATPVEGRRRPKIIGGKGFPEEW